MFRFLISLVLCMAYPCVFAQLNLDRSVVAWNLFKEFVKNATLVYEGATVLDGGTTPFLLKSGLTEYSIYIRQTSLGNWQNQPRIKIECNSNSYYRRIPIEIYDNQKNISPDCTIDNFIALFKNKQLWATKESMEILQSLYDSKRDTIHIQNLRKFIDVLILPDKNIIKKLDNILEDKKLIHNNR